jgi:D-galactarolactone cycloisomerase
MKLKRQKIDVTLCEGFLRTRALAALAHAASVQAVPHTWGGPVGMVANLHLAASIPNTSYFEFPHDPARLPVERIPADPEVAA